MPRQSNTGVAKCCSIRRCNTLPRGRALPVAGAAGSAEGLGGW